MIIYTPKHSSFNYSQAKDLYQKYKNLIGDIDDFCQILNSTLFFSFLKDNGEFIGCLYFYQSENKLMINGFANRNMHQENLKILNLATSWFNTDIYARTPHKSAAFCLLRAGFKKIDNQLYIKMKGD